MKAIFIVPVVNNLPVLPPDTTENNEGLQIFEPIDGGIRPGSGWTDIGQSYPDLKPGDIAKVKAADLSALRSPTALILLDTSEATVVAMKADPAYYWVADLEEAVVETIPIESSLTPEQQNEVNRIFDEEVYSKLTDEEKAIFEGES